MRVKLSVLSLLLCPLLSQAATVHDLPGAVQLALQHDPRTVVSLAREAQASAVLSGARSGYRPDVRIVGAVGAAHLNPDAYPETTAHPNQLELTVSETLYDFGRTGAGVDAAKAGRSAVRDSSMATRIDVIRDAAIATLQLDLAHQRLKSEQHNVEVLAQQLAVTQAKLKAGEFTRTDVAQSQARYAAARARERSAQATVTRARARLSQLTGTDTDASLDALPALTTPATLAEALGAIEQHPLLSMRRQQLAAARLQVDQAKAEYKPRLALVGAVGHDNQITYTDTSTDYYSANLQLTVPLYDRGATRASVSRARATVDEYQADLLNTRRSLEQQVRSAWADLSASQDELEAANEQKQAADLALKGVQSELDAGSRTVLDVLNAQQEVLNADLARLDARYQKTISAMALLAATGRLSLASLNP